MPAPGRVASAARGGFAKSGQVNGLHQKPSRIIVWQPLPAADG
jgi:hypothetical protein